MSVTFAEIIAMVDDAGYEVTQEGLDYFFEVLEYVAKGNSILTLPEPEMAVAMLATGWLTVSRRVHDKS